MRYIRYLGTLNEELKPYIGVAIELDKMSYFYHGRKIATVSVNSSISFDYPFFCTDMRGKFISSSSDGEICASAVNRAFSHGEIDKEKFLAKNYGVVGVDYDNLEEIMY